MDKGEDYAPYKKETLGGLGTGEYPLEYCCFLLYNYFVATVTSQS